MNKEEFEEFLHRKIPITKAMGVRVVEFTSSKVRVLAKLEPNINHKLTAFGGSINTLMTICGWAMAFINIKEVDPDVHIVVKKSNIDYLAPIREDFIAECELSDKEIKRDFLEMYARHKKSRLNLSCYIKDKNTIFAKYEGQYVVYK